MSLANKFKVGDIVTIRKGESSCSCKYDGMVAKVVSLTGDDVCNLDIEQSSYGSRAYSEGGFWTAELELATGVDIQRYHNRKRD